MPDYTFPVLYDGARISSDIGPRTAPTAGASSWHGGIDIAAAANSPVVAPVPLEVTYAGEARGYGNVIYANDPYGNQHRFAHLSGFNVQQGQTIMQGAQIGTVGMTGTATGNHLHYEVRDAGGKLLKGLTSDVAKLGKRIASSKLKDVVSGVLSSNPTTAPFAAGAKLLGGGIGIGGDGCGINPICHLRKWLEETEFVERGALFILATIFIIGAIAFLALGLNPKNVAQDLARKAKAAT